MWMAYTIDYAEGYIIANDLKQADNRVAHYFRRSLELNPDLRRTYRQRGYRTIFRHNQSYVEAIPIDPSGEAGSNYDFCCFSELWGAHEDAKKKMWAELTLSPVKFGKSLRWIETYAGYTGQSELLWSLYELAVINGIRLWDDLEVYVNPEARLFCLWNTTPRLPWLTREYYSAEAKTLTPQQFERMHRNQWVTSKDVFIPIEWWDECRDPHLPLLEKNTPVVLAMDAGVSDDSFGIVAVSRHPNEREDTVVRFSQRWLPPEGGKINFQGTEENPGPELTLLRLCERMNIVEIAYDPRELEDMAGRLRRKGVAWFRPFGQNIPRSIADSQLRARIRDRRIHHSGEASLREHISNADAKVDTAEERHIRLIKRANTLKIDLAVALSMADYEAMRLNI